MTLQDRIIEYHYFILDFLGIDRINPPQFTYVSNGSSAADSGITISNEGPAYLLEEIFHYVHLNKEPEVKDLPIVEGFLFKVQSEALGYFFSKFGDPERFPQSLQEVYNFYRQLESKYLDLFNEVNAIQRDDNEVVALKQELGMKYSQTRQSMELLPMFETFYSKLREGRFDETILMKIAARSQFSLAGVSNIFETAVHTLGYNIGEALYAFYEEHNDKGLKLIRGLFSLPVSALHDKIPELFACLSEKGYISHQRINY